MQVKATGIAWYRPENYDRLKSMFKDGNKLPDSFNQWLQSAQKLSDQLTGEGHRVEKAYIDPETFPGWCEANGMAMDAQARMAYANECAAKSFRANVQ